MSTQNSITLDGAREALSFVRDVENRAIWVKMGLALFDEFGDAGFDVWNEWSSSAANYQEKAAKSVWKSLRKMGGPRPATIGSLIWDAKNYGFKLRNDQKARYSAEDIARMERKREARREAQRLAEEAAARKAAQRAAEMWAQAVPATKHPYLTRKGIHPHIARQLDEWVSEYVDDEGEVHTRRVRNALLVPIWSAPGRLSSLQAIFPNKSNALKRDKDYLTDGRKHGCYTLLGKITADTHTVMVGEGYATCASAHEATDYPAMVAFDAGNLEAVCRSVRSKMPGVAIVVLADNDAFTRRQNGEPWNPGIEFGEKAAKAVSGILAVPVFTDLSGQPTDFNDLHAQAGLDAVASQIELAINPPPPDPEPDPPPPWDDDADADDTAPPPEEKKPEPPTESELDRNGHFAILGYDHDIHYMFSFGKRQILPYNLSQFSDATLIGLAPLNWWEMNFPGHKEGIDRKAALEWIVRTAERRGIHDPNRVRGRGAWVDNNRMVYHHGGYLTVDGHPTEVTQIKSRYVYELQGSLPDPAERAMTKEEGAKLVELAGMFRWTQEGSAPLLAGWTALAPICGALKWRPHIWLTGGAGSGKALPHCEKVLTPEGWITMGQIRLGDMVTAPDNTSARVIGVYPQGVLPVYKLTFADGRTARASGDHLWKVRVKGAWKLRTTEQMMEIIGRGTRSSTQLAIPLSDAVEIAPNKRIRAGLPLHPYVLGALLGDGSLVDGVTFTSADEEVSNRVGLLSLDGCEFGSASLASKIQFRFKGLDKYGKSMRSVIKDLRLLGTRSNDKFIPRMYLEASIADRVELLKGLMDTDGYVGTAGGISYCTVSAQLRDDVVELVRSLGGIASVSEKETSYTYKGDKKSGQLAYNINIRLKDRAMAFHLERKAERARQDYQYADCLYLSVESIEPDGEEECSCIAVDHPDRLYLTDNFVVTHNTTILNDFVHSLQGGVDVFAQGNSTEAGLRQTLKADARPVLYDESEQNDEREKMRVQSILSLIRQASTESQAQTLKGTAGGDAMSFHIRSMFCLASIQVGIRHQADQERISILALRPKREDGDAAGTWAKISAALADINADKEMPGRLFRRMMDMLPVVLQNVAVFSKVAAKHFGSQREGDQYGTLLAGCWCLQSDVVATEQEAQGLIDQYNWTEHAESSDTDESVKALSALMERSIRVTGGEQSVYGLIKQGCGIGSPGCESAADALLQRHGMRIKARAGKFRLVLSNNSEALKSLMDGTPFGADLRGLLLRLPDADRCENKPERFSGVSSKCYSISLDDILADQKPIAPEDNF